MQAARQPHPSARSEDEGEVPVVVHLGILAVHLVADGEPGAAANGHARAPQRGMGEREVAQDVVRTEVQRSHRRPEWAGQVVEGAGAGHGAHRRVGHGPGDPLDPARAGTGVGVDTGDHLAAGSVVAGCRSRGDSDPWLVHHRRSVRPCDCCRVVAGAVVDDDDLERRHVLAGEQGQTGAQGRGVVASRDDDGDARQAVPGGCSHPDPSGSGLLSASRTAATTAPTTPAPRSPSVSS